MRLPIAVVVLVAALQLSADSPFECGTTEENHEHVRAMAEFSRLRATRVASHAVAATNAVLRDNVFIVDVDETNTPYRRPFDLAQKSLHFTPAGDESFAVRETDLEWNADTGASLAGSGTRTWTLSQPFRVLGRSVSKLYVTDFNSIHLDTPRIPRARQYGDFELASFAQPVIAPLFITAAIDESDKPPQVLVRESADALTVTWIQEGSYRVQALLSSNGAIRFSYDAVRVPAAGVIVTSGAEAWRSDRTALFDVRDAGGDVEGVRDELRGMLDIESVTASRLGDVDLVEFRITLAEQPDYRRVGASSWVSYSIIPGADPNSSAAVRAVVYGSGPALRLALPVFGGSTDSPAVALEGRTLVVRVPDYVLDVAPVTTVTSRFESERAADVVATQPLALPAVGRRIQSDLSSAGGTTLRMPVLEAFTLPVLDPTRVWDQIRVAHRLSDAAVDAVAIYQTFPTDIILYAGAYATLANTGASGIRPGDAEAQTAAKTPTLLHMNQLSPKASDRSASHVLLHELGHRWLFHFMLAENGAKRYVLNPLRGHPAQWVHTRAAFDVAAADDASAMGGSSFTDNRDGTFTSGSGAHYGYSWLDLYLMGLARPSEVQPFFYIANSNPALGDAYYAPRNKTVRGDRRDVSVQQVIDGTGPRLPAYPDAQRQFKVAFVLVKSREPFAIELDRMAALRALLERDFRTATGGRGEVSTTFVSEPSPRGPRRRAVRK